MCQARRERLRQDLQSLVEVPNQDKEDANDDYILDFSAALRRLEPDQYHSQAQNESSTDESQLKRKTQ